MPCSGRAVASNVRPVTSRTRRSARPWRRAGLVLLAALLVVASVAAQAADLTPVAILLLIVAVVSLAPLAAPVAEP